MLFMAITSTGSAECIAVSSLLTYDVYRKYLKPTATGAEILKWSRIFVGIFGATMGLVAVIFNAFEIDSMSFNEADCEWSNDVDSEGNQIKVGLSMGWVYVFMGNMIGSAVIPVAMAITWKDCNGMGAILGAWSGLFASLASWMITASVMYCDVNYWSLFMDVPLLVGNLVAILFSGLVAGIFGLAKPQNYDWSKMNEHITLVENVKTDVDEWELSKEHLDEALDWSMKYGIGVTLFLVVIWPLFIAHPLGVFPKGVYALWVSVAFVWGYMGMFIIVFLPIYENRNIFLKALVCDFTPVAAASSSTGKPTESSAA
jgi:hypothetical protein